MRAIRQVIAREPRQLDITTHYGEVTMKNSKQIITTKAGYAGMTPRLGYCLLIAGSALIAGCFANDVASVNDVDFP